MMCIDELPCLESGGSISCYGRVCTAHMRSCSSKQSELAPHCICSLSQKMQQSQATCINVVQGCGDRIGLL